MNIEEFKKKPKLTKIILDDETIIQEYGEAIEFWLYDTVDINTYFDFYKSQQENNGEQLNALLRKLILKHDGTTVLADDEMLPVDISLAALMRINEFLGKSRAKSSTPTTGNQQQ